MNRDVDIRLFTSIGGISMANASGNGNFTNAIGH